MLDFMEIGILIIKSNFWLLLKTKTLDINKFTDIFRGRYRENYEEATPLEADKALSYNIPLPHVNHTLKPGHRLMVQIQSTWFPLYDRNPQTYVESIMTAPVDAYQKQRHRIHHNPDYATYLEFNVDGNRWST